MNWKPTKLKIVMSLIIATVISGIIPFPPYINGRLLMAWFLILLFEQANMKYVFVISIIVFVITLLITYWLWSLLQKSKKVS